MPLPNTAVPTAIPLAPTDFAGSVEAEVGLSGSFTAPVDGEYHLTSDTVATWNTQHRQLLGLRMMVR